MLVVTTDRLDGWRVAEYKGLVSGEAIMGANVVRDWIAGVTDIVGGRSGVYESKLRDGRDAALSDMQEEASRMGANAVLAVDLDYETMREGMMMVVASGTAVILERA